MSISLLLIPHLEHKNIISLSISYVYSALQLSHTLVFVRLTKSSTWHLREFRPQSCSSLVLHCRSLEIIFRYISLNWGASFLQRKNHDEDWNLVADDMCEYVLHFYNMMPVAYSFYQKRWPLLALSFKHILKISILICFQIKSQMHTTVIWKGSIHKNTGKPGR